MHKTSLQFTPVHDDSMELHEHHGWPHEEEHDWQHYENKAPIQVGVLEGALIRLSESHHYYSNQTKCTWKQSTVAKMYNIDCKNKTLIKLM